MGREVVLATANPDKGREIEAILGTSTNWKLRPRPQEVPEVEETGSTLEENARLKAAALCRATGKAAVADDTGLEVEALGGRPGVYSARYAGPGASYADNVAKLLGELSGKSDRRAAFTTVAVLACPDGTEVVVSGQLRGRIAEAPRGRGGFGYDPVFVPDEGDGRTLAEMAAGEKNRLSHRGRAFRALASRVAGIDVPPPNRPAAGPAATV